MHVIDIDKDITQINKKIAERNKALLTKNRVFAFDLLGAIGSGKTSLIETLIERLSKEYKIAAIAGDVISDADASRLKKHAILTPTWWNMRLKSFRLIILTYSS